MRLNTRVRYAIRMMADIAKHSDNRPVPLRDVARRQGLSKLYLSQLATPLRNASLLRSLSGNRGGYVLARPAGDITLLEIMEAVDGPVSIIECADNPEFCERAAFCETLTIWRNIDQAVTQVLQKYTLRDLVEMAPARKQNRMACFS